MTALSLVSSLALVLLAEAQTPSADPTKPLALLGVGPGAQKTDPAGLVLSSILISGARKVAIVNGQLVQEQQVLKESGILILKIDADGVTLQQNGRIWRVLLNSLAVRQ